MSFWKRKLPPADPPQYQSPKSSIELVQYEDMETGWMQWDVHRNGRSVTDDYCIESLEVAQKLYQRTLAIERGEIKVGPSKTTLAKEVV